MKQMNRSVRARWITYEITDCIVPATNPLLPSLGTSLGVLLITNTSHDFKLFIKIWAYMKGLTGWRR